MTGVDSNSDNRSYWNRIDRLFTQSVPLVGPELEKMYVERENSPIPFLARALRPERLATKVLFTGQIGSGKTSALVRLLHMLSDDYFTIWIDVFNTMQVDELSIHELLLFVGGGICKVAAKHGLKVDMSLWHGMVDSLNTLIRFASPGAQLIDPTEMLSDIICARGDPTEPLDLVGSAAIQDMRGPLADQLESLHVSSILREMVARLNQIIADIEKAAKKDLLIIIDGLDKMKDNSSAIFGPQNVSVLPKIRCRAVYTFPYELYVMPGFAARRHFDEIHVMPNVTLYSYMNREVRHEPGYQTMRKVIDVRLASIGLDTEALIDHRDLDRIILGSGGNMRNFISLIRIACLEADHNQTRIATIDANRALEQDRVGKLASVSEDDKAYLRELASRPHARPERLHLLDDHIVTYVAGGNLWYDVHPNLWPSLLLHTSPID